MFEEQRLMGKGAMCAVADIRTCVKLKVHMPEGMIRHKSDATLRYKRSCREV